MKSKVIALVAVVIILWLVMSFRISLLLAVTAYCAKNGRTGNDCLLRGQRLVRNFLLPYVQRGG